MSYIREQQGEKVHDASKQMFANEPGQYESGHMFTVGAVQLAHLKIVNKKGRILVTQR